MILKYTSFLVSAARRECEEKQKKVEGEKGTLERKVREANESYQSLVEDLRLMTGERDRVMAEKRKLEVSNLMIAW